MAIALAAIQAAALVVPLHGACCPAGSSDIVCTCGLPGGSEHCPMCSRTRHVAAGCSSGCRHREVPPLMRPGEPAVLPDAPGVIAELTPGSPLPSDASPVTEFTPVPPSPPPRP